MRKHDPGRRDLLLLGASLAVSTCSLPLRSTDRDKPSGGPPWVDLQLIRNATLKLRVGHRTLLVDPYLAAQHEGFSYGGIGQSPLVPLPMPVEQVLAGVDAVFVSHLHSDHFDQAARTALPKAMPILCPAPLENRIRGFGFQSVTGITGAVDWLGLHLQITGGKHGPEAVLPDMGPVNGFVLSGAGMPPLYWVGDSIWCPEVRGAIEDHRPAAIVVHACGATWKGLGPLVMDEAQVEGLMKQWPNGKVIATHMDCVDHATVSRADLHKRFAHLPQLKSRLLIPEDGEWIHRVNRVDGNHLGEAMGMIRY